VPQINLLNKSTESAVNSGVIAKILEGILSFLLCLALLGYGGLYYYSWSLNKQISQVRHQIQERQASGPAGRDELLLRQGQLKEISDLLANHVDWTNFLPTLAKITLKSVSYSSLNATRDGTVRVNVVVGSYTDLDKYLQAFDAVGSKTPLFYDARIVSLGKSTDTSSLSTRATIEMKFKKDLLLTALGTGTKSVSLESDATIPEILGDYTSEAIPTETGPVISSEGFTTDESLLNSVEDDRSGIPMGPLPTNE